MLHFIISKTVTVFTFMFRKKNEKNIIVRTKYTRDTEMLKSNEASEENYTFFKALQVLNPMRSE